MRIYPSDTKRISGYVIIKGGALQPALTMAAEVCHEQRHLLSPEVLFVEAVCQCTPFRIR